MIKVCTHAGLSKSDKRLLTPDRALWTEEPVLGLGLREAEEEGGEAGGAGRRDSDRVFRVLRRPDSSM